MKRERKPNALPLSAEALREIERRGIARHGLADAYHVLMTISLPLLLAAMAGSFVLVNLAFGAVFWLTGGLGGVGQAGFARAFFFSVQTLSTTGYGAVYPDSDAANIVSAIEMLLGLLGTALATGVLFARLSRPRARVLFSRVMVIRDYQGAPTLIFRMANERRNQIAEARVTLTMTRDEPDGEGGMLRRLIPLTLERDTTPVFALSWVVMHRITQASPLHGKDAAAIAAAGHVFICSVRGTDDTLNAEIYARHVYGAENIRFGQRFVDVLTRSEAGRLSIDYALFHDTVEE